MSDTYYHFLPADGRLQFPPHTLVEVGKTLWIDEPPILCQRGFHASLRALDALGYAPGPIVCRVTLHGTILQDTDKAVAQGRTVLAMADATCALHEFACWCAEAALRTAKVEDARCWTAIETKRKWLRGEATDEELTAARGAARGAASAAAAAGWGAARAAALTAALDAALAAALAAALDADRAAASAAARGAARDAQNKRLSEMLDELLGATEAVHA